MTDKYDWGAICDRYEKGETAYSISKSLCGKPSKVGIQKRANREGWIRVSLDAKEAARNLPSVREPTFPRAPSDELGKQTVENAQLVLSAFERAASPKIAAGLVGLTQGQLKTWMDKDHQFAMEIRSRAAQIAADHVRGIRDAEDWKAWKWLLEQNPFSREEYGSQSSKDKQPTIVLNIHRDEVVIDQPQNEPIEVIPEIESSSEPRTLESTEALEAKAKRIRDFWLKSDWAG